MRDRALYDYEALRWMVRIDVEQALPLVQVLVGIAQLR